MVVPLAQSSVGNATSVMSACQYNSQFYLNETQGSDVKSLVKIVASFPGIPVEKDFSYEGNLVHMNN